MVLPAELMDSLVQTLKAHAPVRTGNLRSNGIQGVVNIRPGLYLVQIGYPATGGYPATQDYAKYTHTRNKTSKGWITRAINEWVEKNRSKLQDWIERGGGTT